MARKESFPSAIVSPTTPQAPFDINNLKRHASYERSSPRTPPSPNSRAVRGKGRAKGSRNRPALPESFQGENARGDGDGYNRKRSDSHELNFSPRQTRASVVDNMLLSLDQLFVNTGPPSRDLRVTDASVSATSFYNTPLHLTDSRPRGHTFSSSISSEPDYLRDEAGSRGSNQPNQPTRRHRSNSSSNFQSALGRIDSIRGTEEEKARDKGYEPQRPTGPNGSTNTRPSTRRKSSKSSGSSSVDLGQMIGNPRWQRAIERRSASFDHGYNNRPAFTFETNIIGQHPASAALSSTFPYDDDAAPTPTVRAGPRRDNPSPVVGSFPLQSPRTLAQTLPLRRRGSKKSPAALFSRHDKGDTTDIVGTRDMKGSRVHTRANSQEAAVATVTTNGSSLSQAMSSRRPSMAPTQGQINPQKERPGFFRRVFGSSRNTTPTSHDMQSPQTRPYGSVSTSRTESRNGQLSNGMPSNGPPKSSATGHSATNMAKETPPTTLNKKASFFRRRKKSVSEGIPLPVPPLEFRPELQPAPQVQTVDASPVSSLRKVMDPYLSSPVNSAHPRGGNSVARAGSAPSRFPEPVEPEQLMHNSSALTPNSDIGRVGAHDEQSAPLSKRDNPSVSEGASSTSKIASSDNRFSPSAHRNQEINQFRPDSHDVVEAKGPEAAMNYSSAGSGPVSDAKLGKENQPFPVKGSHSRSGSNKELPKFPRELAPLSIRDNNAQSSSLHGSMPTRTTSRDWNGANILLTPTKDSASTSPKVSTPRSQRVWLHPTASEEDLKKSTKLPHESHESIVSDYKSATSKLATPEVEVSPQAPVIHDEPQPISDVPQPDDSEPTAEEQAQAKRIFDGIDDVVETASAAAWLGDAGADRSRTRKAYLELFDWPGINILAALRIFCNRLLLKGETQQVDRILDAFSTRWCVCNPNHGFKATDVVHTICYSVLLLNTDLHMADIEQKMTRPQFIKNTMPTIQRVAMDAAPDSFDKGRGSMLPPSKGEATDPQSPNVNSATFPIESRGRSASMDIPHRPTYRLTSRPSDHSAHEPLSPNNLSPNNPTPLDYETPLDDCGPLVKAPFNGRLSMWEAQVEIVLKDFYNSIRQQRLPLSGSEEKAVEPYPSSNSLSAFTSGMLRRTPSMLSKAGSEYQTGRGRLLEARMTNGRWSSKTRSRPRLYPSSIVPSSRTSFDDESSALSPSASSIWSKYSLGKTQTSMSVNSFSSAFPQGDYQQSIGFANALSQAIIREEAAGGNNVEETLKAATLLEDETLELAGAPWAKEGILKHKHHLESVDKKAKDRHWNECFAVIEKGWMRLFQFNMNSKSMRQKAKNQKLSGGVVGGGNWSENAEPLGKFLLRQTIASALPPPGYSKLRPHVWALSLPTGAVHLFQVGTPEIVKEFVTTANYWSARLSKEPLIGGISNVEYGWGEGVINLALVPLENRPPSNLGRRPSLQSSLRNSLDQGSTRPKLPGDRIMISDWSPPQQSMMASALMEVDQRKGLVAYVKSIEDELQKHNQLRGPMLLAFSPRHPNHNKAMANWERKSSYLLREIVKFRTYIDCLQAAQVQKEKIYAERAPPMKEGGGEDEKDGGAEMGAVTA
ncbi:Arf guanine nucleotide exchange factor yel1 [Trapelia coarctata]|nr:Arf guanine nucleotide exchange factor yel1 [Trapelia coarctata]